MGDENPWADSPLWQDLMIAHQRQHPELTDEQAATAVLPRLREHQAEAAAQKAAAEALGKAREALWSLLAVRKAMPASAARSWVLRNTSERVSGSIYSLAYHASLRAGEIEEKSSAGRRVLLFPNPSDSFFPLDTDVRSGVYEHYKSAPGDRRCYEVSTVTTHSETGDRFVVYLPRYQAEGVGWINRPFELFVAPKRDAKGDLLPRFRYIGPTM